MTILAVDIGNSSIKLGVFRQNKLTGISRLPSLSTDPHTLKAALAQAFLPLGPLQGLVFCSVVPEINPILMQAGLRLLKTPDRLMVIDPKHFEGQVDLGGYPADQLGSDRLVNVCAAHQLYPNQTLIVVDFGTATTFDIVSAQGVYGGGAITPGIGVFSDALFQNTSRLFPVPLTPPNHVAGMNTTACLQSGLVYGYRGLYGEILNRLKQSCLVTWPDVPLKIIATGGAAHGFAGMFSAPSPETAGLWDVMDPNLTLHGLNMLYEAHAASRPSLMLVAAND